jgi:hypothetical protein
MKLEGGPWNGRKIEDSGKAVVRITIAEKWRNGYPAIGYRCGLASYEPSEDRKQAFWLTNQWDGMTVAIITE